MKIIDDNLINSVVEQAKLSPRLRMNYNFHQSLDEKCHRFLNCLEPGTFIPVHHHPTKAETFVILKGKVRVSTYNDRYWSPVSSVRIVEPMVLTSLKTFGTDWSALNPAYFWSAYVVHHINTHMLGSHLCWPLTHDFVLY